MFNIMTIETIFEYLEESDAPEIYWSKHWFEEVCFTRWAAEELLNAVLDHPMVPAEDTIEEFAIKMEAYSYLSDGTDAKRIFSIAAKTSWEIIEKVRLQANHEILKGEIV